MKPMIGVMRKRAKIGMTSPAAPRITSASDRTGEMSLAGAMFATVAGRAAIFQFDVADGTLPVGRYLWLAAIGGL